MKVYISGPIRGLPRFNFPAFDEAELRFKAWGHEVWSPAAKDRAAGFDEGAQYSPEEYSAWMPTFLRQDIEGVIWAEAIALLPGWADSPGSGWERTAGRLLGGRLLLDAMTGLPLQDTILQEAQRLVSGTRRAAYGHPLDDYTRTAALWSVLLGHPVTAEQAILCMIAMKLSRECNKPGRDNRVDMAGYAACLDEVQLERERRSKE